MKRDILLAFVFTMLAAFNLGCGPEYPNDDNHNGASNMGCKACHVDWEYPGAPELPGNHFDGSSLDWDNCKHCHRQAN